MIIKIDGQEAALPKKPSEIVRAAIDISAEIELISSGHVTFNFKGRSVIPETLKRHRVREVPESKVDLPA
jgi:hypothetical protein